METIDFKYTWAAILLKGTFGLYRNSVSKEYFRGHVNGQRYAIHFIYDTPDDRRILAAEIRRLRANQQRLAA